MHGVSVVARNVRYSGPEVINRTQLNFITSVEHENTVENDISDLSTDLSLSAVYNLGSRLKQPLLNTDVLIL